MVSTCYNVKVRLLYRSLQGLTLILNTQLNGNIIEEWRHIYANFRDRLE